MFSFMLSMGVLSALWRLLYFCKSQKLNSADETKLISAVPFVLLVGALCAHVLDVFVHGGICAVFSGDFFKYGITFLGSVIGGVLYLAAHAKIAKVSFLYLLNVYLPMFAIAQAWGRIGCFLGGCCYGMPSSFGLVYPEHSLPAQEHFGVSLFPVQLFESAYLFAIFFIILRFVQFKHHAAAYLILMPLGRFFFEYLRADKRGTLFFELLSPAQVISIGMLGIGLAILKGEKLCLSNRIHEN